MFMCCLDFSGRFFDIADIKPVCFGRERRSAFNGTRVIINGQVITLSIIEIWFGLKLQLVQKMAQLFCLSISAVTWYRKLRREWFFDTQTGIAKSRVVKANPANGPFVFSTGCFTIMSNTSVWTSIIALNFCRRVLLSWYSRENKFKSFILKRPQ